MTRQFRVVMERDPDGWFVVECPELPGCVSQGRTQDEAIANIREAIALSVESRREHGLPLSLYADVRSVEVEVPA